MRHFKERGFRPPRSIVLAAIAVALMAVPSRFTEPVRLSALSSLIPVRAASERVLGGLASIWPGGNAERVNELEVEVAYWRERASVRTIERDDLARKLDVVAEFPPGTEYAQDDRLVADVVIPHDISLWRRSMLLARGKTHGVQPGDLVVWQNHLVGRVSEAGAYDCRVQMVTTPGFKVGGVVADSGPGRMGIVEGRTGDRARMKWILDDVKVDDGTRVVTSANPGTGVPRGLIVGRLRDEGTDSAGYRALSVEPEIRYAELETVVILLRRS